MFGCAQPAPAVKTENYEIGLGELAYFYVKSMQSTVSAYSDAELGEMGFDKSKSPSEQIFSGDNTWHDLFMQNALDYVTELLLLCEAAREAGLSVGPEDNLDERLEKFKSDCEEKYSVTFEKYLETAFYGYTDETAYRNALELEILANKYLDSVNDGFFNGVSDTRVADYLKKAENKDTTPTRNAEVILLTGDARLGADEIISSASDRDFSELAEEFSENDEYFYENCKKGDMEEKIDAWLYAADRKIGDIAKIESGNALFIVLYSGEGLPLCELLAREALAREDYLAHLTLLAKKFPVNTNEEIINSLDI